MQSIYYIKSKNFKDVWIMGRHHNITTENFIGIMNCSCSFKLIKQMKLWYPETKNIKCMS